MQDSKSEMYRKEVNGMSYINEYIKKGFGALDLEKELLKLIGKYNKMRNACLLVYAAAAEKQVPLVPLVQSDFYTIRDLLTPQTSRYSNVDVYIETPGGSGETAEEIVRFLHSKFEKVAFVVSGEAKSAGTIMVLSGNEILMTETGSLGPVDAQIRVGRSVVSARDYIQWVEDKQKEAKKNRALNPFDAMMVAQITPGELNAAMHALDFAKDLVVEWLPKYKFRDWKVTETRKKKVTENIKKTRARDIAEELTNRKHWRTHGRSIKMGDLESERIGLKIKHVDKDARLADVVYRIQTVCRLLFDNTASFKIFATADHKIFRSATLASKPIAIPPHPAVVTVEQKCPKCGRTYRFYAKFVKNRAIDADCREKGLTPFPKDAKIKCDCSFEIDLLGIKNQIEIDTGRKIICD